MGKEIALKTSTWTLFAALISTYTVVYWIWKHPQDLVGIAIFSIAAIIFYISTIGHYRSGY
jgi:hypothetical protein